MERKEGPSPKETANSVGYVVGFVFGKKYNVWKRSYTTGCINIKGLKYKK